MTTKTIKNDNIIDSKYIFIWKDNEFTYLQIYGTVMSIDKKDWIQIKRQLKKLK